MHSDKPYDSICTVKTTKVLVTQGNGNQARQAFKSAFLRGKQHSITNKKIKKRCQRSSLTRAKLQVGAKHKNQRSTTGTALKLKK